MVQWLKSGIIEYLFFNKRTCKVRATNVVTKETHGILLRHQNWHVREIAENEMIRLGDLG